MTIDWRFVRVVRANDSVVIASSWRKVQLHEEKRD
jgi:hypothetical protein